MSRHPLNLSYCASVPIWTTLLLVRKIFIIVWKCYWFDERERIVLYFHTILFIYFIYSFTLIHTHNTHTLRYHFRGKWLANSQWLSDSQCLVIEQCSDSSIYTICLIRKAFIIWNLTIVLELSCFHFSLKF